MTDIRSNYEKKVSLKPTLIVKIEIRFRLVSVGGIWDANCSH